MSSMTKRLDERDIALLADFAEEAKTTGIDGDLLTFKKGVWLRGTAKVPVADGELFLSLPLTIEHGFTRFFAGKVMDERFHGLGNPHVTRDQLGHDDKTVWENHEDGHSKDPWAEFWRMKLKDMRTGETLTFSSPSKGGRAALGELCGQCKEHCRHHPGSSPVVRLEACTYQHKRFGTISKPKFQVVSWAAWDDRPINGKSNVQLSHEDDQPDVPDAEASDTQDEVNLENELSDEITF